MAEGLLFAPPALWTADDEDDRLERLEARRAELQAKAEEGTRMHVPAAFIPPLMGWPAAVLCSLGRRLVPCRCHIFATSLFRLALCNTSPFSCCSPFSSPLFSCAVAGVRAAALRVVREKRRLWFEMQTPDVQRRILHRRYALPRPRPRSLLFRWCTVCPFAV